MERGKKEERKGNGRIRKGLLINPSNILGKEEEKREL